MIKATDTWQTIRGFIGGLNTFDQPAAVGDNEVTAVANMIYDGGYIQTRPGSTKLIDAPTGAGNPLQTMVAHTSDGIEYLIGIYENKFYLYHDANKEWLQINLTYVPDEIDKVYGWVNWNNGRGDDRLYFCNGIDDFGKWLMAVDVVVNPTFPGSPTLTLSDSTRFPASGTVVVKNSSGNDINLNFTANSGNVLTLDVPLTDTISNNASIAMSVQHMPDMQLGKVVVKWQSRLMVMNYYGGETVVWYSVLSSPEDFTTGDTVEAAGTDVISDGNGEITAANDFGTFLVIEKEDSFHTFQFVISSDLGSKQSQIDPILSGQSIGPLMQGTVVRSTNMLLYPTRTEGFVSMTPASTGGQVSVSPTIISQKIQPTVTNALGYDNCKGVLFNQKAVWAVSMKGAQQNVVVVYYDVLRASWSVVDSWAVQDFAAKDRKLFYMDNSNGSIQQIFTGGFTDNNNPYTAQFFTKKFDFNTLAQPKTEDLVYVEGFITAASKIYVDVMMNEGGSLSKQTYLISKDTVGIQLSDPISAMLAAFIVGELPFGWVPVGEIGDLAFFRIYLGTAINFGFYNIQLRFYSSNGAFYGITGVGFNPELMPVIPNEMVASPIPSIL